MSDTKQIWTPTNVAAVALLILSTLWLAWWFYDRSNYVYVTDARISSTMINVSSRIPGWVVDFPLTEGQRVNEGELLVKIDARDTELQLKEIEARLVTWGSEFEKRQLELTLAEKQTASALATEQSVLAASQAQLSGALVEKNRAAKELKRATSLLADKMISEETFDQREAAYHQAVEAESRQKAEVSAAKARVLSAEANLARLDVLRKELEITGQKRRELEVERDRLATRLDDHLILSQIPGVVDETFINAGEYVYPGQRILMLHNPDNVWVKANIKETDIRNIKVGSPVEVSVDAYPGQTLQGKVTRIGESATSQFAMLPSPNPSGNFTKTTQRLEVRVDLTEVGALPLKPGMMVELQIPVSS